MTIKQEIVDEKNHILSPRQNIDTIPTYGGIVKAPIFYPKRNAFEYVEFMIWEVEYEKRPSSDDLFVNVKCKRCYPQTEPERYYGGVIEFPDPILGQKMYHNE